ncbi:MAG TPA: sulfur carrier protein ThiS [Gemmataceae bacterium]|jgi:thiazole synthase|nr:sulfur carrier protein ThiS [Gemmataceae bacterium]
MPTITVNGESQPLPEGATVAQVLERLGFDRRRIAVEVNREVIPLSLHAELRLRENDAVEIVTLVGGGAGEPAPPAEPPLVVGSFKFQSRLITGTGKYATFELMQSCLAASGCEVTTVAVRRERLVDKQGRSILDYLDLNKYTILPNTAGCFSADDAVRHARLARELLGNLGNPGARWVKLECLGDPRTLLPDPIDTLKATEQLVKEGFEVLVYTSDDPIMARRLKQAGAASVMPAGSPIGSGQGVLNTNNLRIILEYLKADDPTYPVIVDAGVGTASDVAVAMELGCDGVLLNTAIANAQDPLGMAWAMRYACDAGRLAARSGRIPRKLYAQASSPTEGMIAKS